MKLGDIWNHSNAYYLHIYLIMVGLKSNIPPALYMGDIVCLIYIYIYIIHYCVKTVNSHHTHDENIEW